MKDKTYNIVAAVIVFVALGILVWNVTRSIQCMRSGGVVVHDFAKQPHCLVDNKMVW